ncbi:MAG: phosphopantothenoylcysteine decarboxylase [Sulfurovum sp.]|nr:phosphopantothenoylcysteine decarboxylase [Sulfurovum sp.]
MADLGNGALAQPEEIVWETAKILLSQSFWHNRDIVITGGGTREKIDEVRYISNFSSGKMAKALALSLYLRGANVHYITTMGTEGLPLGIKCKEVEDAQEMFTQTQQALAHTDKTRTPYLFMVAAVADYTPESPQKGKLKKASLGKSWQIKLKQTTDILANIDKKHIKTIAFKAEMDSQKGLANATSLLSAKNVDAVCYNLLRDAKSFGGEHNAITFITKEKRYDLGYHSKMTLCDKIIDHAKELLDE